jgi:4'-phosphopantetheinyl transferase
MDSSTSVQFYNTSGNSSPDSLAVLSPEEHARAARFHFERDRQRWSQGRAWVKQQLAAQLAVPPNAVILTTEPGGRPFLADHPGFDFNLSHTGDWIALATSRNGRIGLDIEIIDPAFPALEIATEFFLPQEHAWVASGPIDRFFQLWTAKEALMKATGRGMSLAPDKILVSLNGDQPAMVTNLETGDTHDVISSPGPGSTIVAVVRLASL